MATATGGSGPQYSPVNSGATESREKYWSWITDGRPVTIFGKCKKVWSTKRISKAGDTYPSFGAEINLTQADFQRFNIAIEVVQIFGGAKLIIPPHWQVRSEMVAIFGGIDDKRPPQMNQ